MDNEKLLYGLAMMQQIEMDDEDSEELQKDAEIMYDINTIIEAIGTEEFKPIFNNFISSVNNMTLQKQQEFAYTIVRTVQQMYDFEFIPTPDLITLPQIRRSYDLIRFLEFDFIEFCAKAWKYLTDIRTTNIDMFCTSNQKRVMTAIEKAIRETNFGKYSDGQLTRLFLGTYNREGMIKLFIRMSKSERQLILLSILEGEHYGKESS